MINDYDNDNDDNDEDDDGDDGDYTEIISTCTQPIHFTSINFLFVRTSDHLFVYE